MFLADEYGADYKLAEPVEVRGVRGPPDLRDRRRRRWRSSRRRSRSCASCSARSRRRPACATTAPIDGVSPGICHQVAREQFIDPGDFVQATDSHTCMGGASGALAWGVGATEYAALIYWGFTPIAVPESIRFELTGRLRAGVSAKDVMLHILATYAKREETLNRVMEFGGEGLFALSPDERATLANMATECSARGAVMEVDDTMLRWIAERRPGERELDALRAKVVTPDPGAHYDGGVHRIDLAAIRPMVATPGDPDRGIASDPKNGALVPRDRPGQDRHRVRRLVHRRQARRHRHVRARDGRRRARRQARRRRREVLHPVRLAGRRALRARARLHRAVRAHRRRGDQARLRRVHRLRPRRVATAAIRSPCRRSTATTRAAPGPGKLYLASPLTVAASAVAGEIVEYEDGMFAGKK